MKTIFSKIQKYIAKYKIFKPFLKTYLQESGYARGYLTLTKMVIGDGLRSIYRQLVNGNNETTEKKKNKIVTLQDIDTCTYVIVAPDFISNSAGICCLYKLCHDLRKKGYMTAMIGTTKTPSGLDTPIIINPNLIEKIRRKKNTWAIYAETVTGNPLKFKNVARWVLNRPGLLGGDEIYQNDEKIFVYSNVYVPYVKNVIQGKLNMPSFDRTLFYPPKEEDFGKRNLTCFYVGKSTFKEGYFNSDEAFEITRFTPAKKELGKLLRSAKVLYSFDNSTALIYEAIACGCPVQIIPDGTQTWEDYEKLEWGTTGIFWDKPAQDLTLDDVNGLLDKIKQTENQYEIELDNFIKLTAGAL